MRVSSYRLQSPPRHCRRPEPEPPRQALAVAAEGALIAGLPALTGQSLGSLGVMLSCGGGAIAGRHFWAPEGAIRGAATGLVAAAAGRAMGPGGVLLAAGIGAAINLAINNEVLE